MSNLTGYVSEIFAGIQGEGTWVGQRQVFLRLAGCQDHCFYCDTPQSRQRHPLRARLAFPGREEKPEWLANPMTGSTVVDTLSGLIDEFGPFHSLAITGGEPLEQPDFVKTCLREFKKRFRRFPILLETNGHQVEALSQVVKLIDFLAADIKLRSATGKPTPWAQHVQFLKKARRLAGCVKVVVVPATTALEIVHAARLAEECVPGWDFILQPASGVNWKHPAARRRLELFVQTAARLHRHLRLIPQIHPGLGWA